MDARPVCIYQVGHRPAGDDERASGSRNVVATAGDLLARSAQGGACFCLTDIEGDPYGTDGDVGRTSRTRGPRRAWGARLAGLTGLTRLTRKPLLSWRARRPRWALLSLPASIALAGHELPRRPGRQDTARDLRFRDPGRARERDCIPWQVSGGAGALVSTAPVKAGAVGPGGTLDAWRPNRSRQARRTRISHWPRGPLRTGRSDSADRDVDRRRVLAVRTPTDGERVGCRREACWQRSLDLVRIRRQDVQRRFVEDDAYGRRGQMRASYGHQLLIQVDLHAGD